jgi:hypothetical protein
MWVIKIEPGAKKHRLVIAIITRKGVAGGDSLVKC